MRILWLLPDLDYSSASRQAQLVVPELIKLGHEVSIATLRSGGAFASELKSAGIHLRELSTPHDLPMRSVLELQALRRESIDVVHAWRIPSLRAYCTAQVGRRNAPRLIASQSRRGGRFTAMDRMLVARIDRIVDDAPLAIGRYERQPWPKELELPDGARVIVCIGALNAEHGFHDAIWAFDVLEFVYKDLHLVIIGDGPEHDKLKEFARSVSGGGGRVRFLPGRIDAPSFIPNAEVVWSPGRKACGEQVALEARAVGVPVVATNFQGMAKILAHGKAGVLLPKGAQVELAKATRPLLDDETRRIEMSKIGMASGHTPGEVAKFWSNVYSN